MNARFFLLCGIIFMILAVLLGAFGAHALKSILTDHSIQLWKTATDYQFYHALGLISLGIWGQQTRLSLIGSSAGLFLILGIILFSGSLYLLALTGLTKLGMITPIGGIFFILGWCLWLTAVIKTKPRCQPDC